MYVIPIRMITWYHPVSQIEFLDLPRAIILALFFFFFFWLASTFIFSGTMKLNVSLY
jgi:hypothetical protein